MTKVTKSTQIKAVEKVFALKNNGVSTSNARKIVALEFNTSVCKLTKWQKEHGPITTSDTTSKTNNVVVSRRNTSTKGLSDLSDSLFSTIEDLKVGDITAKEAGAMSSLAGNIVNIKKLQFSAHKYVNKAANQSTTIDKLLN